MPYPICRHIKTDGLQCQSPALRRQSFCYFHHSSRLRHRAANSATNCAPTYAPTLDRNGNFSMEALPPGSTASPAIELGLLEDSQSVQVAISVVINALARNQMEQRRATALLYGLQLAAMNCRNVEEVDFIDRRKVLRHAIFNKKGEAIAPIGLHNGEEWNYQDADTEENEEEQPHDAEEGDTDGQDCEHRDKDEENS